MGLLKEQCAEWKKGHLRYCCNQVWMKIGGQILWNAIPFLRNVTDLLSDGKTTYETRFGESLKWPIIPFGSLVEYYPISAKDQSRIHQFWKESLTWNILRIRIDRGVNLERRQFGYRHWKAGKFWKRQKSMLETQCKRSANAKEIRQHRSRRSVRYTSLTTTISHDNHRTSKHASTSWRSDGSPPCLGGSSHGWVPVKTPSTPVPTSVERLWVAH